MMLFRKPAALPTAAEALPGRAQAVPTASTHLVFKNDLQGPFAPDTEVAYFGLGCFWGAERMFWQLGAGIVSTAVGYQGGQTPNPTYNEVCSGRTGHTEIVKVVYDPSRVSFSQLLKVFWENHDPTQGMRQGNDVGTQYRSAIYTTTPEQKTEAEDSRVAYADALAAARGGRFSPISTEIREAAPFYFAEDYHQQYLAKNPGGYCNLAGTGVSCPIGVGVAVA